MSLRTCVYGPAIQHAGRNGVTWCIPMWTLNSFNVCVCTCILSSCIPYLKKAVVRSLKCLSLVDKLKLASDFFHYFTDPCGSTKVGKECLKCTLRTLQFIHSMQYDITNNSCGICFLGQVRPQIETMKFWHHKHLDHVREMHARGGSSSKRIHQVAIVSANKIYSCDW